MANGGDVLDGLQRAPWYVQLVARYGLPTVFAGVLLWFVLTQISAGLATIIRANETIITNQARIVETQVALSKLLREHIDGTAQMAGFLGALCYNTATSETARRRCSDVLVTPRTTGP